MTPFELAEPTSLADAVALLDPNDPGIRPISGGTAVMLMMKTGLYRPEKLVSLRKIEPRYAEIAKTDDGGVRIGAMTTLSRIEASAEVAEAAPVVVGAMKRLSNVRVRNVATLGGNLAHADPHMDLPPILIALGATVTATGPNGSRSLAAEALFKGYLETDLAPDELISEVELPALAGRRAAYMKVTTRSADDWPALGIAAALDLADDTIRGVRLAIGAATETPRRLPAAEAELAGGRLSEEAVARAADAAAAAAEVESDQRGSASYKKELIRVYTARAVRAALAEGGAA